MTIFPRVTRRGGHLDWVKFDFILSRDGSVDPTDKALYAAIASFVDLETRESPETADIDLNGIPEDVPTRKRLAACIGRSVDTVDRATKRLEDRGLLRVHRQADPDNPRVMLPSEYELLDHELWDQRAAERAARRAARRQASSISAGQRGGRMGAATPGGTGAATPGRMDAAVKDKREVEEENGEEGGGDGRQASTGSRRSSSGGSAASGNSKPPSLTRAQWQQADAFFQALPKQFADLVPAHPPRNLTAAVLEALAAGQPQERTAQQLIDFRLLPKWDKHYASRDTAGPLERPVGVLITMLRRDAECQDPRCDERTNVDTGEACRSCEQRAVDRRADRERERTAGEAPPLLQEAAERVVIPSQNAAATNRARCEQCGGLIRLSAEVGDMLCKECRPTGPAPVGADSSEVSVRAAAVRRNMVDRSALPRR